MDFSIFVGICTIVSTVVAVITLSVRLYDRKRKWAVSHTDDSLTS